MARSERSDGRAALERTSIGASARPSLRSGRGTRRKGLAPLELVLSLPILLAIMGLIVVFGSAASWKLRTEVVSRDVLWRHRWPTANRFHSQPPAWPTSAGASVAAGEPIATLADPALHPPVVSGPLPGGVRVNDDVLDYLRGSGIAEADIQRRPPLFREMPSYRFRVETMLLDDKFQYRQMGLDRNRRRRLPLIYDLPEPPGDLTAAYRNAVQANETALLDRRLWPLDRDPLLNWADQYPRLRLFTSLDHEWVEEHRVEPLIDRIEDLPELMARLYRLLTILDGQRQDPPLGSYRRQTVVFRGLATAATSDWQVVFRGLATAATRDWELRDGCFVAAVASGGGP